MNVQEFIDYKKVCPICQNDQLHLIFKSQKRQILHRDNDRIIVIFDMNSIKRGNKSYRVGYSISKLDNSFQIEFYNKDIIDDSYQSVVPVFLLTRFKEFNKNQVEYMFFKTCLICHGYNYQTDYFKLDLKSSTIAAPTIIHELFSFKHSYLDKKYHIILRNDVSNSSFSITELGTNKGKEFTKFDLPRIQFTNSDDVGNRLLKLIKFS